MANVELFFFKTRQGFNYELRVNGQLIFSFENEDQARQAAKNLAAALLTEHQEVYQVPA